MILDPARVGRLASNDSNRASYALLPRHVPRAQNCSCTARPTSTETRMTDSHASAMKHRTCSSDNAPVLSPCACDPAAAVVQRSASRDVRSWSRAQPIRARERSYPACRTSRTRSRPCGPRAARRPAAWSAFLCQRAEDARHQPHRHADQGAQLLVGLVSVREEASQRLLQKPARRRARPGPGPGG